MDSKNIVSVAFQLTLFGSLYFGPLATSSLTLTFSMALRSPVITWPCGSLQNLDYLNWQVCGLERYSETFKFEMAGVLFFHIKPYILYMVALPHKCGVQ